MRINLTLEDKESEVLVRLLDLACKAGGLGVAREILYFNDKINREIANVRNNEQIAKDSEMNGEEAIEPTKK